MPILRVSPRNGNEKSGQFPVSFRSESSQFPANSQVFNSIGNGCKACNRVIQKYINVQNHGRFCSKECWNAYYLAEGGDRVRETLKARQSKQALTDENRSYRLRNGEDWLLELKNYHLSLANSNARHSSVYTCECSFALTLRASELGLFHSEMIELKEII